MTSQIDIIEVRQGACLVCHAKDDLVGLRFRAKVLRFCRKHLYIIGGGIQKLKGSEDGKTDK